MANTSDELVNLMQGVQGDPNDPAVQKQKLALLFSRWGRPQVQPSSAPDTLDETPGAGDDGGSQGFRQSKPAPGSSEMSSGSPDPAEPKPSNGPVNLAKAGHMPRSLQPSNDAPTSDSTADLESRVGLPALPRAEDAAEPGSTEDLENRVQSSVPGMFAFAARQQKPHGVLGILSAIGKQALGRLGNAGYAISGGDPREMALKEQESRFEEEMAREKADPEYQRQVAQATTPEDITVAEAPGGGYQYVRINKFTGQASPTGVSAPTPEKSPAQVLNEFVQQHPDALIKGTEANQHFEELAESMRAFPSQQAQIRANAEMYVGRLGVQRAIVQADGLIRAMQGRGITDMASQQANALNEQLKAAAEGWEKFYTDHPYLEAMGIGPDPQGQAQFMAGIIAQLQTLGLQTQQTVQKIPGAAQVAPKNQNQVPSLIGNAANAANRGKVATEAHIADYARQKGISVQQAEQEFRQSGYTVIPAPMTR